LLSFQLPIFSLLSLPPPEYEKGEKIRTQNVKEKGGKPKDKGEIEVKG
jgi:hypothetical protein